MVFLFQYLNSSFSLLFQLLKEVKECDTKVGYRMDRVKRIWYLWPMRAAKVQASLRIRAVLPEPSLLAHTSSESRGTFRQKARSLAPLNGWACTVTICHDGMLEDTNLLDGARMYCKYWDIVNIGTPSIFAKIIIFQSCKIWDKSKFTIFCLLVGMEESWFGFRSPYDNSTRFKPSHLSRWDKIDLSHLSHVMRKPVLCCMQTTKTQISLRIHTV